ncbi:MAG: PorT family protein [Prevotella sp.]|jgi:hypothetical protein|nr:PorT family protein [Prevotella sp.]
MKKMIFLVAALLMISAAQAQLVTSTSVNYEKNRKSIWLMRAGFTSAGLGDSDKAMGYNASLEFNSSANKFYWGSGLVFGNWGGKDYVRTKLELPLNFGYKYGITDDVKLDGHFGGFVNYDLFGKEPDPADEYKLGYGIQLGAGAWFQKFNLNLQYQIGLDDREEKNLMVSVGYAF